MIIIISLNLNQYKFIKILNNNWYAWKKINVYFQKIQEKMNTRKLTKVHL